MRSFMLRAACVLAAALVAAGAGCSKTGGKGGDADSIAAAKAAAKKIVVRVNGTSISQLDVQHQTEVLLDQIGAFADSAQMAAMMPTIREQALDNAINRILLEEAVKRLGIEVDKAKVDERIAAYRQNFISEEAWNADLAKRHVSRDGLFGEIETALQAEELFKRRTAGLPPPTDAELREFYDGNPSQFQNPERVRASHILIKVAKTDADDVKAQKRKRIEDILASLKKGADFAEAARANSECPSKENGGDLGFFERGSMVPEFETAAFAMKQGQLSGIVETQFGFHIIKVTDKAKAGATEFEQAKQQIAPYLTQKKKNEAIIAYFDTLRSEASIEYIDSTFVR